MTPTKEPGRNKNNKGESAVVCLLPTGSANETIEGISHLFEHIFISKLGDNPKLSNARGGAHTTEDYVILFLYNLTPGNIIDTLKEMRFEKTDLDYHKEQLKEEIEKEALNPEEFFFRFVWQGTDYEKSPLGTIHRVNTISPYILEDFRRRLIKKNIFFYREESGVEKVEIVNAHETGTNTIPIEPLPVSTAWKRNKVFQGKTYYIRYFNKNIEAFYLLKTVLKQLNPEKHIQLSEKKRMSALIFEKGTRFPSNHNIDSLKEKAFEKIRDDLSGIKTNFKERALNELESMYFYGQRWSERIQRLFQTDNRQLLELA